MKLAHVIAGAALLACGVLHAADAERPQEAGGPASTDDGKLLVGGVMPPYPDGLQEIQGSCLGPTREINDPCGASLELLGTSATKLTTIIAARLNHHDAEGHAVWEVTDQAPYPKVPHGFTFAMSNCALANVRDQSLLAVVRVSRDAAWGSATWALRLNVESGVFETVNPARITCNNTRDEG